MVLHDLLALRQLVASLQHNVGLADARLTPHEHGTAGLVSDGDGLSDLGQFHGIAPLTSWFGSTKSAIRRDHRFRSYIVHQLLLFVNRLYIRVSVGRDPHQRREHLTLATTGLQQMTMP
jgi:hypothetical protein